MPYELEPVKIYPQRCFRCDRPMTIGETAYAHVVNPVAVCSSATTSPGQRAGRPWRRRSSLNEAPDRQAAARSRGNRPEVQDDVRDDEGSGARRPRPS